MTRAQEIIQELAEVDQQLEDLASEELVLDTRKTVLLAERRRLKKEKRNVKKQSEGRRASARIAGKRPCRADSGTGAGTSKKPGRDQEASSSEDSFTDDPLQYTEAERRYIIGWPFDVPGTSGGMLQGGWEERRAALIKEHKRRHKRRCTRRAGSDAGAGTSKRPHTDQEGPFDEESSSSEDER